MERGKRTSSLSSLRLHTHFFTPPKCSHSTMSHVLIWVFGKGVGLSLCGLKFTYSTALLDIALVSGLSFNLMQWGSKHYCCHSSSLSQ